MASAPRLNEDVLLRILQSVSPRCDVLALGLSNKKLFSMAAPELIYRTIRCHLNNDAVWEHLIANPAAASRVRELEILRENPGSTPFHPERVPSKRLSNSPAMSQTFNPSPAELEKSEGLLIQALHVMVNLESFIWDRWVPVINVSSKDDESPCTEDIWTALRDYTQLKRLSVVDLGLQEVIVVEPCPIFRSSIFTLRNLTHVKLKVYYSPIDVEDSSDSDDDSSDDGNWSLRRPQVNTTRLKECLHNCPNLQALDLTIIDRIFYWTHHGIPYADATSIFEGANWPSLQSLYLWDLTVDSRVMLSFLLRHPTLLSLEAGLSMDARGLPKEPFAFDNLTRESALFLPNIRSLDLKSSTLHSMSHLITYPWSVQSLGVLTPRDWGAPPPIVSSNLPALDYWGVFSHGQLETSPVEVNDGLSRSLDLNLNLSGMPHLRSVILGHLERVSQLETLATLTPQLEVLRIRSVLVSQLYDRPKPHSLWLPALSKWPHLKAVYGIALWSWSPFDGHPCNVPQDILREVVEACPSLRRVGDAVEIVQQDGQVVLQVIEPTRK